MAWLGQFGRCVFEGNDILKDRVETDDAMGSSTCLGKKPSYPRFALASLMFSQSAENLNVNPRAVCPNRLQMLMHLQAIEAIARAPKIGNRLGSRLDADRDSNATPMHTRSRPASLHLAPIWSRACPSMTAPFAA